MSDTKRSHEAIADEAAQRYIADSLAAPHIMLIQRRSFIAGYEAAAALREPIAVTDACPEPIVTPGYFLATHEVTEEMVEAAQRVPLNVSGRVYLRLVIEAALKVRSEE